MFICRLGDVLNSNISLCSLSESPCPPSFPWTHMKEATFLPFLVWMSLEVKGGFVLGDRGQLPAPLKWVGGLTQGTGCDEASSSEPRASPGGSCFTGKWSLPEEAWPWGLLPKGRSLHTAQSFFKLAQLWVLTVLKSQADSLEQRIAREFTALSRASNFSY